MKSDWRNMMLLTGVVFLKAPTVFAGNVVLVNSYHADYPWSQECRAGFDAFLDSPHQVTYLEMDTKRLPASRFEEQADEVWRQLSQLDADIVVTMDDNALKYLGQRIHDKGLPLVFMGVSNNPRLYFDNKAMPDKVTGVLERPPLKEAVNEISIIFPAKTSRILLLMDNSNSSRAILQNISGGHQILRLSRYVLHTALIGSYAQWQARVSSLTETDYDAVIIDSYASVKDDSGTQVPVNKLIRWTSQHSALPLFAFWRYSVGKGKALGGLISNCHDHGRLAAMQVNQILSTGNFPIWQSPSQTSFIYSQSELRRWGITLPEEIKSHSEFID